MFRLINNWIKRKVHLWLFSYNYDLQLLEGGRKPLKTYKNDAGYDLHVAKNVIIPAGGSTNVATGIACKGSSVPAWIFLTGRSSTLIRHGLIVNNGIIDGDYTGELGMIVYNPTKTPVSLYPGMRIGQVIVIPHTSINFRFVSKLKVKKNERGLSGFGSTGQ